MRRTLLCAGAAALAWVSAVHVHALFAWFVCAFLVFGLAGVRSWRRAAFAGGLFGGLAVVGAHGVWLSAAVGSYFHLPATSAAVGAGLFALLCGASFGAVLGLLCNAALACGGLAALAVGCAWVLWESLVAGTIPYYPWASLAVTQADQLAVAQIAGWLGHAAVSFAVATVGGALGLACATPSRHPRPALAVSALAMALLVFCAARLRLAPAAVEEERDRCSLSAIDAAIPSARLARGEVLSRYRAATEAALDGRPDAVVWPESALPASPLVDADLRRWLQERARDWGVVLIAGGPRLAWTGGWQPRVFNSVFRIVAKEPIEHYDKRRLVPFAEYWPRIGLPRPHWLRADETVSGHGARLFSAGSCRLGVLICFEGHDAGLAQELARAGADALLVLSNDAHLSPAASRLEVAQLRLRAVETGLAVVRAANRGLSVAIDRNGRLLDSSSGPLLHASIATRAPAAAVAWAPLFRLLCHAGALTAVAVSLLRQRRARGDSGEHSLSKLST